MSLSGHVKSVYWPVTTANCHRRSTRVPCIGQNIGSSVELACSRGVCVINDRGRVDVSKWGTEGRRGGAGG